MKKQFLLGQKEHLLVCGFSYKSNVLFCFVFKWELTIEDDNMRWQKFEEREDFYIKNGYLFMLNLTIYHEDSFHKAIEMRSSDP